MGGYMIFGGIKAPEGGAERPLRFRRQTFKRQSRPPLSGRMAEGGGGGGVGLCPSLPRSRYVRSLCKRREKGCTSPNLRSASWRSPQPDSVSSHPTVLLVRTASRKGRLRTP